LGKNLCVTRVARVERYRPIESLSRLGVFPARTKHTRQDEPGLSHILGGS